MSESIIRQLRVIFEVWRSLAWSERLESFIPNIHWLTHKSFRLCDLRCVPSRFDQFLHRIFDLQWFQLTVPDYPLQFIHSHLGDSALLILLPYFYLELLYLHLFLPKSSLVLSISLLELLLKLFILFELSLLLLFQLIYLILLLLSFLIWVPSFLSHKLPNFCLELFFLD